jgi:HSP20 family molecular chaperone IbpA
MPSLIDPERVSAQLENGILEILLPKVIPAKEMIAIAKAA